jgi:hypothetical protein
MPKYEIVKASSYDPSALADQLTEKSAEGWEVVAIVPTGGDVTAFLRRDGDPVPVEAPAEAPAMEMAAAVEAASAPYTPEPVAEPAGWGVAPEPNTAEPTPMAPIAEPVTSQAPPTVSMYQPTTPAASAPAAAPAAAAVPSVPAGWYADPSGRFEQRYWDGGTWTEHVARGGAQYTDPPVA